mgnify:CR=1 FL=1
MREPGQRRESAHHGPASSAAREAVRREQERQQWEEDEIRFEQGQGNSDLKPGDLLLALEFTNATDGRAVLEPIDSVAELRDIFSDLLIGKTKGQDHYKFAAEYKAWVARGDTVLQVTVRAKRLFW